MSWIEMIRENNLHWFLVMSYTFWIQMASTYNERSATRGDISRRIGISLVQSLLYSALSLSTNFIELILLTLATDMFSLAREKFVLRGIGRAEVLMKGYIKNVFFLTGLIVAALVVLKLTGDTTFSSFGRIYGTPNFEWVSILIVLWCLSRTGMQPFQFWHADIAQGMSLTGFLNTIVVEPFVWLCIFFKIRAALPDSYSTLMGVTVFWFCIAASIISMMIVRIQMSWRRCLVGLQAGSFAAIVAASVFENSDQLLIYCGLICTPLVILSWLGERIERGLWRELTLTDLWRMKLDLPMSLCGTMSLFLFFAVVLGGFVSLYEKHNLPSSQFIGAVAVIIATSMAVATILSRIHSLPISRGLAAQPRLDHVRTIIFSWDHLVGAFIAFVARWWT